MMHADSGCEYRAYGTFVLPRIRAIGWLSKDSPFETGTVSRSWLDKLAELILRDNVAQVRGFDYCPFCDDEEPRVERGLKRRLLGSAEVWVPPGSACDGYVALAAPNLIYHYIVRHHYKPPSCFIDAVERFDLSGDWSGEAVLQAELQDNSRA